MGKPNPIGTGWIATALAAYAITRLAPPLASLTPLGQAVLGAALAGTILWVSEAVPLGVTAIVVLILLGLCPGVRLADAVGGFASDVTFFLIGATAIGAAVETSGLAARAAHFLSRSARGSPARLYAQMIAGLPLLALMVPSAITRNAILIPAYRDALTAMGAGQASRVGRAVMLALGMLNPLASSALLTGGITSITAATLLGGFSWLTWFALMAAPYYALLVLGAVYLRLMVGRFEAGSAGCRDDLIRRDPLSGAELRTLAVLAITSLMWLTDHLHGLSPAIPALIGAALLLLPGTGALTWKTFEARLSWGLILTVGTSLSLAVLMTRSGAAAWLGQLFFQHLSTLAGAPLVLVAGLIVATALVHLAITNLAACIALLLPINATIAQAAGLNPLVTGLLITIVVDAVILYPVQTASNLMAYESGYFGRADVRRLGLGMLALVMLVSVLVLPYWSRLGLPLAVR
ncbi:MAG: anion permease [Hyphomonadaceae bacterium]|nr:anion permease [Hyphomonadaceae bacterium]